MLVISANEQRSLMKMNEVIDQTAEALCEFSAGRTLTPIRTSLPFGNSQNTTLVMPSIAENLGSLGLKVVNINTGNSGSRLLQPVNGFLKTGGIHCQAFSTCSPPCAFFSMFYIISWIDKQTKF